MKTKSKIKLFATAVIATASIGIAGGITQSNTAIASEVTVTERDGFPTVTFETDAVFKNFEEANAYAEGRASEILEATDGYKDYSLNAGPALDGTSNYLVSGEIRAYKDYSGASVTAEQAKKNIEAAARKVVKDANSSISTTKPITPTKPVEEVKPVTPAKPSEDIKPETPTKPVEEVKPETPAKPAEDIKPETPAKPVEEVKPVTPTKPVEDVKPETPAKPVENIKPETPAKPAEDVKPVTPAKPAEEVKPETPAKPVEDVKPETPTKPVDEGKTSNDIQEITGEFTEIKTTSTGVTFKAKLSEGVPHAGSDIPNIQATLTDKATGKDVAKSSVVLEGLSQGLKNQALNSPLYYSNLLESTIFEPSLTPGNYVLTVEGTTGTPYGQSSDNKKRHFIFRTEITLTGESNSTTTAQPEKPKDSTTKPKSDQTTNNVNNNQQPSNDKNKQITNNNIDNQDKNELSTNKTSDTKTSKQTSDNTLPQEKQQTTSTSTTKQEDNKNNDKKTLPNTGESRSTLGIIGTVLSITGLGFIAKRKRG